MVYVVPVPRFKLSLTNLVVAICVVFVPTDAVGALGVPLNSGSTFGAAKDVNPSIANWIVFAVAPIVELTVNAMLLAYQCYERKKRDNDINNSICEQNDMKEIEKYNEIDCKSMWGILNYLRLNH